jgi:hypothetical protein
LAFSPSCCILVWSCRTVAAFCEVAVALLGFVVELVR